MSDDVCHACNCEQPPHAKDNADFPDDSFQCLGEDISWCSPRHTPSKTLTTSKLQR